MNIYKDPDVMLSIPFVFYDCASISALFQIQYLRFYSTYQRAPPLLAAASPYSSFFSLYLDFIEISCV